MKLCLLTQSRGQQTKFKKKKYIEKTLESLLGTKIQEKRQGKMTVARALDSDNVRVRSLASIKRRREKARMQADQTPAVKQFREVIICQTQLQYLNYK